MNDFFLTNEWFLQLINDFYKWGISVTTNECVLQLMNDSEKKWMSFSTS
jgi:hypothetical protein